MSSQSHITSTAFVFLLSLILLPATRANYIGNGKAENCMELSPPRNGNVFYEKYGSSAQVAEFICRRGFRLVGARWLKCSANGMWSGIAPSCIDIDECSSTTSERPCSEHADCVNLVGTYRCFCWAGFRGNGKKCIASSANLLRRGDTCGTVSIRKLNDTMRHRRVVGGRQAMPGEWPWQVMIHLKKKGIPFAGGALLDKKWVVTLSSVLQSGGTKLSPSDITIVLGDYDRRKRDFQEQRFKVKRIIRYPGFEWTTLNNDIALLELDGQVTMGTYVNKVCLLSGRKSKKFVKASKMATISGWGTTRAVGIGSKPGDFSDVLQEVNLPLVSSRKCQLATAYSFNTRSQICAGFYADQKSPCYGDAGSPLVTQDPDSGRWVLMGLFSWSEGCGQKHKFSYYTRVAKFRKWLVSTMKNS